MRYQAVKDRLNIKIYTSPKINKKQQSRSQKPNVPAYITRKFPYILNLQPLYTYSYKNPSHKTSISPLPQFNKGVPDPATLHAPSYSLPRCMYKEQPHSLRLGTRKKCTVPKKPSSSRPAKQNKTKKFHPTPTRVPACTTY